MNVSLLWQFVPKARILPLPPSPVIIQTLDYAKAIENDCDFGAANSNKAIRCSPHLGS